MILRYRIFLNLKQLILYYKFELAVCIYSFLQRHRIMSTQQLNQVFLQNRFIVSFRTFVGRYQHLVEIKCSFSCVQMTNDGVTN